MDAMDTTYDFIRSILCPSTKPLSLKQQLARGAAVFFTEYAQHMEQQNSCCKQKTRMKNCTEFITGIRSLRTHLKYVKPSKYTSYNSFMKCFMKWTPKII